MKISNAQQKALRDVRDTGNFGLHVRFTTKAAVCSRGWVSVQRGKRPLKLTALGRAALGEASK